MIDRSRFGRRGLLASAGAAFATSSHSVRSQDTAGPLWVVELFTSQGCSSCPPADRILGELSKRAELLALSFHVDYWDYIGWKDPFASAANTHRQHHYAKALKQRYVYTPEMVFHGLMHDPGRDRAQTERMLAKCRQEAREKSLPYLSPALARDPRRGVTVTLPGVDLQRSAEIWLVTFDAEHRTRVARGENAGSTLSNFNVVRSIEQLARWTGGASTWSIPGERLHAGQSIAVLVQYEGCGPMLGAARLNG